MAKQRCTRPRILFVDDEESIRLTLPYVLSKSGFEVMSVGTLADALAKIRTERFDILLSDLNLPEPNAGFTVITAMHKVQPRCINFILTGYPADESLRRANADKVARLLRKAGGDRGNGRNDERENLRSGIQRIRLRLALFRFGERWKNAPASSSAAQRTRKVQRSNG